MYTVADVLNLYKTADNLDESYIIPKYFDRLDLALVTSLIWDFELIHFEDIRGLRPATRLLPNSEDNFIALKNWLENSRSLLKKK